MNQSTNRVPVPTLERMATYLACLQDLDARGVETISSAEIEKLTHVNAAQFRKDLSYFGEFGRPGIGYSVPELARRISKILKVDREQPVVLVGAGNLGSALVGYPSLSREHFRIAAVFDNSPSKIGRRLWDHEIRDIATLPEVNREVGARLGIIAVPASAAQSVADLMVGAGITAILNFAPVSLKVPQGVVVRNVDFVQEMAVLSYHLAV
ncbi:MAG: redox-sensing transcriptional repressor Rex 1 [Armatimonadota bacterium]|nr:MAG: redox-sensing transcriptional repressor Rex 1 [Armatimonadota bacterium]